MQSEFVTLMKDCWQQVPDDRPNFLEILDILEDIKCPTPQYPVPQVLTPKSTGTGGGDKRRNDVYNSNAGKTSSAPRSPKTPTNNNNNSTPTSPSTGSGVPSTTASVSSEFSLPADTDIQASSNYVSIVDNGVTEEEEEEDDLDLPPDEERPLIGNKHTD